MPRPTRYPPHFRADAIARVRRVQPDHSSEWSAIQAVASSLAISAETLRTWVRQAESLSDGQRTTARRQQAEIRRLIRENAELRRALDILRGPEPSRPPTRPAVNRSVPKATGGSVTPT
ncbi:Transposase [Frankia torreyi]|uniref:Transposase n=4 Tax=Frankia TaxID=1854 RepID=A0A0D8BBX4_9ACTN|nr:MULTISPECIES: transposase [Frankia]KJE21585.1 Transposase [Frankia torreyi]KQM03724.1 Transposase [Frankia sp. CpI1-P]